jgi:imidazole glycerol-phosphate synthase subunit HisH
MKRIGIVNYGCGNSASLGNALEKIECTYGYIITEKEFDLYDAYILPGVGAFKRAMDQLEHRNMIDPLIYNIKKGKNILGICLGMQLLFENSLENGYQKGLGYLAGSVEKIKSNKKCRIPHMGWNDLNNEYTDDIKIFNNIDKESSYYFVHSYYVIPKKEINHVTTTHCEQNILAAFEYENISGVQFHPEKSHDAGLELLCNFCLKQA